jgi:TnpA family transposase
VELLPEMCGRPHGYTDLNFALFDLVGKTFAPRIRDIKNQRLYKIKIANQNVELDYPELKFTGTVSISQKQCR